MAFSDRISAVVVNLAVWMEGRVLAVRCFLRLLILVRDTFYVSGRHLYDHCGERTVLRGVNKMAGYSGDDPTCLHIFPEIRRTGANVVRIVWLTETSQFPKATVANLDAVITNCRAQDMIPMIELHDATAGPESPFSKLGLLVKYWTRPDVVAVLKKHSQYLLLNIGNEVGDDTVTDADYVQGYKNAIAAIRGTGVKVPLVIDAAGFGQETRYILNNAATLLSTDPQRNLMFSLHVWWHFHANAIADFTKAVRDVVNARIPFLVGEFAGVCQKCDNTNNDAPFAEILNLCEENSIGWIVWEWGPGNEFGDPPCPAMNITSDGTYAGVQPGWASSVVNDHPFSLKNRSVRPYSMVNHGRCVCP
ncbi:MAG: glycoside hydrolase family 5 protein [Longimicrobiaceae bacterium]